MAKIIVNRTFEVFREGCIGEEGEEWRFERGSTYELVGMTENMFNPNLIYLYLGDFDHCYLVEKKDIIIL